MSLEEQACEDSFNINTTRRADGHFVVTLSLKVDPSILGDEYMGAKRRFLS